MRFRCEEARGLAETHLAQPGGWARVGPSDPPARPRAPAGGERREGAWGAKIATSGERAEDCPARAPEPAAAAALAHGGGGCGRGSSSAAASIGAEALLRRRRRGAWQGSVEKKWCSAVGSKFEKKMSFFFHDTHHTHFDERGEDLSTGQRCELCLPKEAAGSSMDRTLGRREGGESVWVCVGGLHRRASPPPGGHGN